jgi:hypothetical protein
VINGNEIKKRPTSTDRPHIICLHQDVPETSEVSPTQEKLQRKRRQKKNSQKKRAKTINDTGNGKAIRNIPTCSPTHEPLHCSFRIQVKSRGINQ